ncbi:MAG: cupin domain-containing protein [Rickettsiales bacterium]
MRFLCISILSLVLFAPYALRAEPAVVNIHPEAITSKQGLKQFVGVSRKNSGATGISMNKVVIPPGGAAKPHSHSNFESTIYVMKGRVRTYYGKDLKDSIVSEAGDFIYIPPNTPHYPVNLSKTEEAIGIVARTDPEEQEHVMMYEGELPKHDHEE